MVVYFNLLIVSFYLDFVKMFTIKKIAMPFLAKCNILNECARIFQGKCKTNLCSLKKKTHIVHMFKVPVR